MEAQQKKEAAAQAAIVQAKKEQSQMQQHKNYRLTNTLSKKFAKMQDGISTLAP